MVVAIGGEPATGKTLLMLKLIEKLSAETEGFTFTFKKLRGTSFGNVHVFGIYNGQTFQGTDRLSMAVQPDAIEFIGHLPSTDRVVFEGDRLFNGKLFVQLSKLGRSLQVVLLQASEGEKVRRHRLREDDQTPAFLRSRATKYRNIANGTYPGSSEVQAEWHLRQSELPAHVETNAAFLIDLLKK
jgi:hypothetical protein